MKRQYHEPETYSRQEVRAMQEACTQKIAEARKQAFLEAAEMADFALTGCWGEGCDSVRQLADEIRAKAEEQ